MYLKSLGIITLLSITMSIPAKNNNVAPKPEIIAYNITHNGDSVNLDILFQLKSDLPSSATIEMTPYLSKQDKTEVFPSLILSGKQRHKINQRSYSLMSIEEKKQMDQSGIQFLEVYSAPYIHQYNGKIPYNEWMRNASLELSIFECQCGKENNKTLSYKDLTANISRSKSDHKKKSSNKINSSNILLQSNVSFPNPYDAIIPQLKIADIKPHIYDQDQQEIKYEIQFDYEVLRTRLNEDFKNNRSSIQELTRQIEELIQNDAFIKKIYINGYASPEGGYDQNMRLSKKRAIEFSKQLQTYFNFYKNLFQVNWHGEDWEGLKKLIESNVTNYQEDALSIIKEYGIFEGREKHLMDLHFGNAYKDMAKNYFPLLRRVDFRIVYSKSPYNIDSIKAMYQTNVQKLTINELNQLLSMEKFASKEYRQILAHIQERYPNDETAILNTAAIHLIDNKPEEAWNYLKRKYSKKRISQYENNLGVYYLMIGNRNKALQLFEKAAASGYEPAKENIKHITN